MFCLSKLGTISQFIIFDLDDTLVPRYKIEPLPYVEEKLKDLARKKYGIVVISNQATKKPIEQRFQHIFKWLESLKFPLILVYAVLTYNVYRKPFTTLIEHNVLPIVNKNQEILYCIGDAAGRENDFSDSDRAFAYNISLLFRFLNIPTKVIFLTPQEFFLDEKKKNKKWRKPDPRDFISVKNIDNVKFQKAIYFLIGPPGSGKTTLAEKLRKEGSIVIDHMNASKEDRAKYLKNFSGKIIAIVMEGSNDFFRHMNNFRAKLEADKLTYNLKECEFPAINIKPVPELVYKMYEKKFESVTLSEGFSEIIYYKPPLKIKRKKELMFFKQRD